MLAAPEATDWAAHPAARTGKLEKRGRLKDEWKARHFELRGCYLVCFADAKPGRPALAVFDVTKVACARDANDRRAAAAPRRKADIASAAAGGSAAARPLCSNVRNTRTRAIGAILIKNH